MQSFTIKLLRRETVADRTTAVHFEKPEGFQFKAGQTLDLTLIDPPETDGEGNTRTFSIASAPQESYFFIATRIRASAFKRVLSAVALGTSVQMEGPMGSFTLHNNRVKPAVFLAGGIGITPFRSMIVDAAERKIEQQLWLFYSNKRPEDTAFLAELRRLADTRQSFHYVPTMTDMEHSARVWHGESAFIDGNMLSRHIPDIRGPIYYLAGPPAMVTALRDVLLKAGVDEDDIRAEEFAGY